MVLDGEMAVTDASGITDSGSAELYEKSQPQNLIYIVFDLLALAVRTCGGAA
jgi:ATP-dependent DNA ligase